VDQLGGLDQAIESAARRARLPAGFRVFYVEPERGLRERLAEMLFARAAGLVPEADTPTGLASVDGALRGMRADLERLARWNDPRGAYAHCLCGED
jgi:protease-4